MGTCATVLEAAPAELVDRVNRVEVQLLHAGMALKDAEESRLLASANLAVIGDELIQFGVADPLGAGRWRLSNLLRGRRGTAAAAHAVGEQSVVIDADTLHVFDPPIAMVGERCDCSPPAWGTACRSLQTRQGSARRYGPRRRYSSPPGDERMAATI